MNDQNIVHRMLAKGDALRDHYNGFDFSQLDSSQQSVLRKLSFFSRNRERIVNKFNSTKIGYDVKIAFLDQHSMKLGNRIFYDLESKRQDYVTSFDIMPVSTFILGACFFAFFAVRTPMSSKLYKELGYSVVLGGLCSYTYVHYYKRLYLNFVDDIYLKLRDKFATNPMLSTIKEDQQIIKNFGYNKFSDDEEEDEGEDDLGFKEMGLFEGDPDKESSEYKNKLIEHFYGS